MNEEILLGIVIGAVIAVIGTLLVRMLIDKFVTSTGTLYIINFGEEDEEVAGLKFDEAVEVVKRKKYIILKVDKSGNAPK